ncbi:MAG: DNA cytosine methyltransferase [Candidatus Sedimenticola sp. 6PFRAG7]
MLSFIDLFCGGGFGARGAVSDGAQPLLGIDAWELATKTYKANFPSAQVITNRIESIDPYALSKTYKPDVLLTSPECTSHSIARGAKPGSEKSRETAIGILPWTDALKPRWVIVENVARMKQWHRHNELVGSLESSGYRVSDLYLNAADFGTPQSRKRMFLVCDLYGTKVTTDELIKMHKRTNKTASSIINWNGKYKSSPLYKEGRAKATIERAERAMDALGKNKPFLIVYYGSDYAGGWQSLDAPLRTITTLDRFGLVTWEKGEPYLRMLQPDELSAAMGAGSKHELPFGTRREKVHLCGNGVCSPVMELIFRHMRKTEEKEAKIAS